MKINYFKVIAIVLILVVIFYQIRIVSILIDKAELLETDPFVAGARSFNIDYCSCFISETATLEFTQNYSKITIRPKYHQGIFNNYKEVN
jgi:hypothetical protein